jgi:hypothetical protein
MKTTNKRDVVKAVHDEFALKNLIKAVEQALCSGLPVLGKLPNAKKMKILGYRRGWVK